jgi:choline dehydrogenase-like flavoprotein
VVQGAGVDSLRVVDASILPDVPSVATNGTTIMAERIAATLVAAHAPYSPRAIWQGATTGSM